MGYEIRSNTGETLLIKHSELGAAYKLAGLVFAGPGYVNASDAKRLAEAVRLELQFLDDIITPDMAAEGGFTGDDPDKPSSHLIRHVPRRTRLDAQIMAQLMELAEAGDFEVRRIP